MRQNGIVIGGQWPDEEGNGGERLPRVTIQGLFFVIDLLLGSRSILQHVFGSGKEDLSPPESHEGEEEEDGPSDTDKDDHDGVPHDEPMQIENVRQDADDGDETHIWKPTTPIKNRFHVNGTRNGRAEQSPKRSRRWRKLT